MPGMLNGMDALEFLTRYYALLCKHIEPEVRQEARRKLAALFARENEKAQLVAAN